MFPKKLSAMLGMLLVAALAHAAPRPKDKGYVPDGWVDILCNQPPSERPWIAMENHCRQMDRDTWMEVGRELSNRMRARLKRLNYEHDWPSVFDAPDSDLIREHVAGVMWHYKWIEANKGNADPFQPPSYFWESGKAIIEP